MGFLETLAGTAGNFFGARANRKDARQAKKDNLNLIKSLDWEPMYASDVAPTFKRTESPVARSYLESFLMGNNPDATFGRRTNADVTKAQQQQSQNAMFGTPEARIARQRAIEQETPWKVTAPTREVGQKRSEASSAAGDPNADKNAPIFQSMNPRFKEAGGDEAMYQDLVKHGILSDQGDFRPRTSIPDGTIAMRQKMLAKNPEWLKKAYAAKDYDAIKKVLGPRGIDVLTTAGQAANSATADVSRRVEAQWQHAWSKYATEKKGA